MCDPLQPPTGPGQLNLPEQAFNVSNQENDIQVSDTVVVNTRVINETHFQWRRVRNSQVASYFTPTVTVQGAFTNGGSNSGVAREITRTSLNCRITRPQRQQSHHTLWRPSARLSRRQLLHCGVQRKLSIHLDRSVPRADAVAVPGHRHSESVGRGQFCSMERSFTRTTGASGPISP